MNLDQHSNATTPPICNDGEQQLIAQLDMDDYRDDLKNLDLTPEQEAELLTRLWEMMKSFVELGFGVDSMHLILPEIFNSTSQTPETMLTNKHNEKGDDE